LVCTKSNASRATAQDLNDHFHVCGSQTSIVLCQNGWGNADVFASFFPESVLFNARVITGFQRPRPNTVDITVHVAPVCIGSIYHGRTADINPLCTAIQAGGLPCESTAEIVKDLWAKMLYNCALNPLGAIFRVPYGALGASPHTRAIMEDVVREIFQVMAAAGYETYWRRPEDYLTLLFDELIPTTAKHEASTLQDIRAGKPTEIDTLNGAVVTLGDRNGIDVPVNRQICRMIKFAENGVPSNPANTLDAGSLLQG
jgi:2-dehydropantoate 2-reductase